MFGRWGVAKQWAVNARQPMARTRGLIGVIQDYLLFVCTVDLVYFSSGFQQCRHHSTKQSAIRRPQQPHDIPARRHEHRALQAERPEPVPAAIAAKTRSATATKRQISLEQVLHDLVDTGAPRMGAFQHMPGLFAVIPE